MGNIGIYFWEELFRSEQLWEGFQWIGAKHSDAKIWFFTTCNFKDDMIWCHKMTNSLEKVVTYITHCKVSKSESPKPRIVLWPLQQCTIVIGAKRLVGSGSVKMIVKWLPRAVQLSPVPSGYPNPTRYPVFLLIPDLTRFSFRNHRVAGNPKHRVLPDISGKPEVSGTTRYLGYHP